MFRPFVFLFSLVILSCENRKEPVEEQAPPPDIIITEVASDHSPRIFRSPNGSILVSWVREYPSRPPELLIAHYDITLSILRDTVSVYPARGLTIHGIRNHDLVSTESGIMAVWTTTSGKEDKTVEKMHYSISSDGGKTWSKRKDVFGTADTISIGFYRLSVTDEQFGLTVIAGSSDQNMTASIIQSIYRENKWDSVRIISDSICRCCRFGIATGNEGESVVYRKAASENSSPVLLAHYSEDGINERLVFSEKSEPEGCVDTGPVMDWFGNRFYFAWFNGKAGDELIYCRSRISGTGFTVPVVVRQNPTIENIGLYSLRNGHSLLVWDEVNRSDQQQRRRTGIDIRDERGNEVTSYFLPEENSNHSPVILVNGSETYMAYVVAEPDRTLIKVRVLETKPRKAPRGKNRMTGVTVS